MIDPVKMSSMFTGVQPVQPVQADEPQQPVQQPTQPVQSPVPVVPAAPAGGAMDDLQLLDDIVTQVAQTAPTPAPATAPMQPVQADEPQQPTIPDQAQLEGVMPQAVMQAAATSSTLNPPNPAPATAKETFERPIAPDAVVDANAAVQHVETEPNPEIPVEVEGFLQRVEDNKDKLPNEVVIADGTNEKATTNYPSRPVIVLPITEKQEEEGKNKSPRFSIRWLVEWSHKIIKMFAGKVIYRHEEEN